MSIYNIAFLFIRNSICVYLNFDVLTFNIYYFKYKTLLYIVLLCESIIPPFLIYRQSPPHRLWKSPHGHTPQILCMNFHLSGTARA